MSDFKPPSGIFKFFTNVDSIVSSSVFEAFDWMKRNYSAYSAWMTRWRVFGLKRFSVDILSDAATLA